MAEYQAEFIKIPTHATDGFQTMPVKPDKRIPADDIVLEICDERDADKIVSSTAPIPSLLEKQAKKEKKISVVFD